MSLIRYQGLYVIHGESVTGPGYEKEPCPVGKISTIAFREATRWQFILLVDQNLHDKFELDR